MKLYEYQAKKIFKEQGINIPDGQTVLTEKEAGKVATELGSVVLKPQLSVKGRGKVGGILFADTSGEAEVAAGKLLSMTIKGEKVRKLLVECKATIRKELYMSIAIDYSAQMPVAMACSEGGVDIEKVAAENPEKILKIHYSLEKGLSEGYLNEVDEKLGQGAGEIMRKLSVIFSEYDAEMIEINPVVITEDGNWLAVDGVLNVNDDSLFRHPDLLELKEEKLDLNTLEEKAKAESWTYIELDGNIGILSSGAGITMAILDFLNKENCPPANFLDTAQMDREGIYKAFELLLENENVKVVLVNIFAGLNRCDDLAEGLKKFIEEKKPSQPIVVRMIGNKEEEGFRILKEIGIEPVTEVEKAIEKTVEIIRGLK